jgi:hypothetical protein
MIRDDEGFDRVVLHIAAVSAGVEAMHASSLHSRNLRKRRRCTTSVTSVRVREITVGLSRSILPVVGGVFSYLDERQSEPEAQETIELIMAALTAFRPGASEKEYCLKRSADVTGSLPGTRRLQLQLQ